MGLKEFFAKINPFAKKEAEVGDKLATIGIYTISDPKLKQRLAELMNLIDEFDKPIMGTPLERLDAYSTRIQVSYFTVKRLAIPYLRIMDQANRVYGEALGAYEKFYEYTISHLSDYRRILSSDERIDRFEIMANFEFRIHAYLFMMMQTIIDWSFTGADVAPSYSISVQSMMPQQGHTLPAGIGPGFQQPQQQQQQLPPPMRD